MYALKVTVVELDLSSLKVKRRRSSGAAAVQSGLEFFKKKSPRSGRSPTKLGKYNVESSEGSGEEKLQLDPYVCVQFRDKVLKTGKLNKEDTGSEKISKSKWRWDEEFVIDLPESLDVLVATGAFIDIVSKASLILKENVTHVSPSIDSPKNENNGSDVSDSDTVLGGVRIPLSRLSTESKVEQWYELSYTEDYAAAYGKYFASVWRNLTTGKAGESREKSPSASSITRQSCGGVLLLGLELVDKSLLFKREISSPDHAQEEQRIHAVDPVQTPGGNTFNTDVKANTKAESSPQSENNSKKKLPKRKITSRRRRRHPAKLQLEKRLAEYLVFSTKRIDTEGLGLGYCKSTPFEHQHGACECVQLQNRFPQEDHEDLALPVKIEWFCFANNPDMKQKVSVDFYTFVHAPRGVRLYGFCLTYYTTLELDLADSGSAGSKTDDPDPRGSSIYAVSLCVISRLGMGGVFERCLRHVYSVVEDCRGSNPCMRFSTHCALVSHLLEYTASILVGKVPIPVPGILRVTFSIEIDVSQVLEKCNLITESGEDESQLNRPQKFLNVTHEDECDISTDDENKLSLEGIKNLETPRSKSFSCSLGKYGSFPALTFRNGLELMLEYFDVSTIIEIWQAALLEFKIIMYSTRTDMLSVVGETILSLLYPFRWHHPYIPLLPVQIVECVEAPLPYILGIDTSFLELINPQDLEEVVCVDIDNGIVLKGPHVDMPSMPAAENRRLSRMLRHVLKRECSLDSPLVDWNKMDFSCSFNSDYSEAQSKSVEFEHAAPPRPLIVNVKNFETGNSKRIKEQFPDAKLEGTDVISRPERLHRQDLGRRVQLCFIECIASMLQGYKECLFFLDNYLPVFNQPQFLEIRGQDALFYTRLLGTHLFEHFKETQQSKWLQLFHAVYFQDRVRYRDREQYIILESQRHRNNNMQTANSYDLNDRSSENLQRKSLVYHSQLEQLKTLKTQMQPSPILSIEQNNHVWETRRRRRMYLNDYQHASGLEPLSLHEDEDGFFREWLSTIDVSQEKYSSNSDKFDVNIVSALCGVNVIQLQQGLEDLDRMIGTHKFNINDNYLQRMDSIGSETNVSDSENIDIAQELSDNEPVHGPHIRRTHDDDHDDDHDELRVGRNCANDTPHIPDGFSSISNRDSSASTKTTHLSKREIEKILQDTVTSIFLNKTISLEQVSQCSNCFKQSKHARDVFVLILYQPRNSGLLGKHDTSDRQRQKSKRKMSIFAHTGRGLRKEAFESLALISRALVDACALSFDYSNGRQVLELSKSYYVEQEIVHARDEVARNIADLEHLSHVKNTSPGSRNRLRRGSFSISHSYSNQLSDNRKRHSVQVNGSLLNSKNLIMGSNYRRFQRPSTVVGDYLESRLIGLDLWQSLLFWENAFEDILAMESRKRTRTLSTSISLADQEERASMGISQEDLEEHLNPEEQEFQDTLFELTTKMAYQMIRLGVREDTAKALVSRVVTEHGMKEEHEETLYTLITNVSRAAKIK